MSDWEAQLNAIKLVQLCPGIVHLCPLSAMGAFPYTSCCEKAHVLKEPPLVHCALRPSFKARQVLLSCTDALREGRWVVGGMISPSRYAFKAVNLTGGLKANGALCIVNFDF